jgi:3-mercaptopyruvate sulfurtransferase SseA
MIDRRGFRLATVRRMEKVAHVGGGFGAWRDAGGPTEAVEKRK